jgi:hypothetical protein
MIKFASVPTEDNQFGFYIIDGEGSTWRPTRCISSEIKEYDQNHVTIFETYQTERTADFTLFPKAPMGQHPEIVE